MRLGVNYPWFDYGWDFGEAPPSWRGDQPRWLAAIDGDLRHLADLGVGVVRWFVLADGLAYGSGPEAPNRDAASQTGWRFDPPPLGDRVVQHFEALLRRVESAPQVDGHPIRLLPVFIDFEFCKAGSMPVQDCPGWVKGGRAETIADAGRRHRFLDKALEPLLDASREHADAVYAWEVINEPDWVTAGWGSRGTGGAPLSPPAMRAFLEEASARVRNAGFRSTVGFASERGRSQAGVPADVDQVHHYPAGVRSLQPRGDGRRGPAILGEFATTAGDVWPELAASEQDLLNRLRRARSLGYELAIPWSFRARDRHSAWTPAVEHDLRRFAQESKRV